MLVLGNGLPVFRERFDFGRRTVPVKMAMELVLGQYRREQSQTKKQTIPIFAPHRSQKQRPQACLAQVQAQMEQVPSSLAQVRFYSLHLLHEMPFYSLQWRRSPTQNRTCTICRNTCATYRDTCARNTETCSKTVAPAPKKKRPAPTRAQIPSHTIPTMACK